MKLWRRTFFHTEGSRGFLKHILELDFLVEKKFLTLLAELGEEYGEVVDSGKVLPQTCFLLNDENAKGTVEQASSVLFINVFGRR